MEGVERGAWRARLLVGRWVLGAWVRRYTGYCKSCALAEDYF